MYIPAKIIGVFLIEQRLQVSELALALLQYWVVSVQLAASSKTRMKGKAEQFPISFICDAIVSSRDHIAHVHRGSMRGPKGGGGGHFFFVTQSYAL